MSKTLQLRTCIGCGARAGQAALVRIAADPQGTLTPVIRHASGRSAYLHRSAECWERFAGRKGPVRSLQRAVSRSERQTLVARLRAESEL
ncbi:MAG: YlxR family protein [Deltaproteobacteria bacterium]|nr:YlxR family protein [Deltaproteobacteria bacterium]MBI3390029.1 YlxR family protein [Deltaproteobacteria bacterium]